MEGFLRTAQAADLAAPLLSDVLVPLLAGLGSRDRQRAAAVLARWRDDPEPRLQSAAGLLAKELTQ